MSDKENKLDPAHEHEIGEESSECALDEDVELCDSKDKPSNELSEINDKYLRILAEFDNFRKRTAKEKAGMYDDGVVDAVTKFLPFIDNIRRALDSAAHSIDDPLYKGVDMIYCQLLKTLQELGVEEIAAVGEPFDPNRHFAVAHTEDSDYGESTVSEELQKGYRYKDKVLRHSMVKVAN